MKMTDNSPLVRAMVTSPHDLASRAGADVLREGGTAAEAAVAMAAVLSVTYPHFCGIGGDAVWMLADEKGQASCLLGIGQAPGDISAIEAIEHRGPGSMLTTACAVDSWGAALDHSAAHWGGGKTLAALLKPAIAFAQYGFPLSKSQAFWLEMRRSETRNWQGFADHFIEDLGRDKLFRQPALAQTLEAIASGGVREFYEGRLAEKIAEGLAAVGAPLQLRDLAVTRTRRVDPLRLAYGENVVLLAPPPPTQGVTTLQIMGMLDRLRISRTEARSADHYHFCVEAIKRAFVDRQAVADPDFVSVPVDRWLSADYLERQAHRIDRDKALPWPQRFNSGDTVFFAAVDAKGRVASVLQSIYHDWGSGVVVDGTGILWQNRGAAFNLEKGHPNCLAPAKRPFYTLNPGLALRNDSVFLAYGTQGADGQPQTLSLILSLVLDHGMSPAEALAMPRFLLGKTFSDSRDSLKVEEDIGPGVIADLSRRGHAISTIAVKSPLAGQAGMIRIGADGRIEGAHDPRSDGLALAVSL